MLAADLENVPLKLPPVESMALNCYSPEPNYQVRYLRVSWMGIELPSYSFDTYLGGPRRLLRDIYYAAEEHIKLREDPNHKIHGFILPNKTRTIVMRGLWTPMVFPPWEHDDLDDKHLTVVSERLSDHKAVGCTQYIELNEHERILLEATRLTAKTTLGELNDIVSAHVELGVKTGIEKAIQGEIATRRQIEAERQRIEAQKGILEQQLAKLSQIEKRIKQREKEVEAKRIATAEAKKQRMPADSSGFVYLVHGENGYYKIGKAKDPSDRVATFGVKLPFDIEIEHTIKCKNYHEAERHFHNRYADKRVGGEWFALTPEDVNEIKQIKEL